MQISNVAACGCGCPSGGSAVLHFSTGPVDLWMAQQTWVQEVHRSYETKVKKTNKQQQQKPPNTFLFLFFYLKVNNNNSLFAFCLFLSPGGFIV